MKALVVAVAVAVAVAVSLSLPLYALDSDKHQTAILEGDDFEFDLATGVRTYRGNVTFRQGSLRLDCDVLVTHYGEDGAFAQGVCSGSPGRFKQRPEGSDSDVTGRAQRITLDRAAATVTLDGDAEVQQAGDRIEGARITYDLERKRARVTGESSASSSSSATQDDASANPTRPRLIIQPRTPPPN